jgi:hypothetical protein
MPQELRTIHKLGLNAHQTADTASADAGAPDGVSFGVAPMAPAAAAALPTLQLKVTKTGGPVGTFIEVGSTGTDGRVFDDSELTPGPARMPMLRGNSYTVVWRGAFVAAGTATLHVLATRADNTVLVQKDVDVEHPPTNSPFTIVVL